MEDVLDIYEMPYDPAVPVVCMDEKPYQLLGEAREPLPMRPGDTQKLDSEYVRNGTCSIFVFVEPLGGVRHVSVREHRTAADWAEEIRYLVDVSYPGRDKIILVMDNLNTHALSSLYKTFPAPEARRIAKKLEIHYTPKHGSWPDIAEIELNVMTRQCLSRRIEDINLLRQKLSAWESDRNEHTACIQWHFTTDKARTKLTSTIPSSAIQTKNNLAKYKTVNTLAAEYKLLLQCRRYIKLANDPKFVKGPKWEELWTVNTEFTTSVKEPPPNVEKVNQNEPQKQKPFRQTIEI